MQQSGVYCIINKINGKLYIGSAVNLNKRKTIHFSTLKNNKHYNHHLQKAWNKYGEENFEFKIIKYCKKNKLKKYEQNYVDSYQSCNPNCGYNLSVKVDRTMFTKKIVEKIRQKNIGQKRSEETKRRISEACKRINSVNNFSKNKNNINKRFSGKKHSPESIKKIRLKSFIRYAIKKQIQQSLLTGML